MQIDAEGPYVVVVGEEGSAAGEAMVRLVAEFVKQNRAAGVGFRVIDAAEDPRTVRELGVEEPPAYVLFVNGRERARSAGLRTKRQLLGHLLKYVYPEHDEATRQLRRQLDSPAETFPSRREGGHTPLKKADKQNLLRKAPLFGDLTTKQLSRLASFADQVTVAKGQTVTEQGTHGNAMFILVSGKASVRRNGRKIASLEPGDFFGEMALLDGEPRSATVVATTDGELLVVHQRDFDVLLEAIPELARNLLVTLAKRLRTADRRLVG